MIVDGQQIKHQMYHFSKQINHLFFVRVFISYALRQQIEQKTKSFIFKFY